MPTSPADVAARATTFQIAAGTPAVAGVVEEIYGQPHGLVAAWKARSGSVPDAAGTNPPMCLRDCRTRCWDNLVVAESLVQHRKPWRLKVRRTEGARGTDQPLGW
jgi:hypothetical protein